MKRMALVNVIKDPSVVINEYIIHSVDLCCFSNKRNT